jgi:capsular polysaccharide transport system permease protein
MEHKFKQLKESLTPAQFNDIDYLEKHAQSIENNEPWLAKRIRQRITNLNIEKQFDDIQKNLSAEEWNNIEMLEKVKTKYTIEPLILKKFNNRIEILSKLTKAPLAQQTASEIGLKNHNLAKVDKTKSEKKLLVYLKQHTFIALVLIPTLLFTVYQTLIATDRFESQAKVLIQQPDASSTLDASMAILSGLGVSSNGNADPEILKTYINSIDIANYLDKKLNLKAHYQNSKVDIFSRLTNDDQEAYIDFYQKHITVVIDSASGIITISAQGFDSLFANQLVQEIVKQAEWYINSIGHQLAKSQLAFITQEYDNIELKLQKAQTKLLNFQQKYNLLDPTSEGAALQQIAYGLENQITAKETELKNLEHIMSSSSSRILSLKHELSSLKKQLFNERQKMAEGVNNLRSIGDILAEFTDLKVRMELALQAYTASQVSLEKSRIEAYRQLKYLITVDAATTPEENKYPERPYNISLFFVLFSMAYGIGKIIISTIKELG